MQTHFQITIHWKWMLNSQKHSCPLLISVQSRQGIIINIVIFDIMVIIIVIENVICEKNIMFKLGIQMQIWTKIDSEWFMYLLLQAVTSVHHPPLKISHDYHTESSPPAIFFYKINWITEYFTEQWEDVQLEYHLFSNVQNDYLVLCQRNKRHCQNQPATPDCHHF